jgi:hypothetical protein
MCDECNAGRFGREAGLSHCEPCEAGTYCLKG